MEQDQKAGGRKDVQDHAILLGRGGLWSLRSHRMFDNVRRDEREIQFRHI